MSKTNKRETGVGAFKIPGPPDASGTVCHLSPIYSELSSIEKLADQQSMMVYADAESVIDVQVPVVNISHLGVMEANECPWHFAFSPGITACGADDANQRMTDIKENVTCNLCIAICRGGEYDFGVVEVEK